MGDFQFLSNIRGLPSQLLKQKFSLSCPQNLISYLIRYKAKILLLASDKAQILFTRGDWTTINFTSHQTVRRASLRTSITAKVKPLTVAIITDQVMKLLEWALDFNMHEMVNIDQMQFDIVPSRGTTNAIFIVWQLPEKCITAKKPLYFAFVDLEKAFNHVPRKVLWWALRSLGWRNGLCRSSRACTPRPGVLCESMVSTVRSLV